MRRPLGCMTFSALIAAVVTAVVILVAAAATGNGIFSPGSLSAEARGEPINGVSSHAELEGRCDACHAVPLSGDRMAERCLACHAQVREEISAGAGLHGRFAEVDDCRGCHTDHRGRTASLTLADPSAFPHDRTGYSLQAHPLRSQGGSVGCVDCHPGSPISFTPAACLPCHEKGDQSYMTQHVETFGTACLDCHDGIDTYGADFDHATYPLTGEHEEAPCGVCHQQATTIEALKATETECLACHAADDIHEGRLGTSCEECHTPATWTDATLDHDRTRFPLVGKHEGVLCGSCHVDRHWAGIGLTCRACHATDDPHAGQFPGDCAACHTAEGWEDVTFDHADTTFALTGGHAKPGCSDCHPNGRYVGTPTACIGCHADDDPHDGAFGKDCAACHKTTTWSDWTFDHDRSSFPLTGTHRSVACVKCHVGGRYQGTPTACSACHPKPASHGAALSGVCSACHKTTTWADWSFDHSRASFQLTGAHRSVSCQKCHVGGRYQGTPSTCAACHSRPASHGTVLSGGCANCHTTTAWKPASYDGPHPFPMNHGGAGGSCAKCHPSSFTGYSCTACHSKTKMAEHHKEIPGYSATDCLKCHPKGVKED